MLCADPTVPALGVALMGTLWIVAALVVGLLAWLANETNWAWLRNTVESLPEETRQDLRLLLAAAALLILRGIVLLVVDRDVALVSIVMGWVLGATVLVVAYHLPRG